MGKKQIGMSSNIKNRIIGFVGGFLFGTFLCVFTAWSGVFTSVQATLIIGGGFSTGIGLLVAFFPSKTTEKVLSYIMAILSP